MLLQKVTGILCLCILQGEPGIGLRGERGSTGQKGDKGDRGHLGLPVSSHCHKTLIHLAHYLFIYSFITFCFCVWFHMVYVCK